MDAKAVADHIAQWLLSYNTEAKTNGFVVGVSGGIDSALTSTLGAMTGLPMICVEMPIHQNSTQVNRASDHIAWLKQKYPNVSLEHVELTNIFDSLVSALPSTYEKTREMSLVNTRARLRMTTLYYFAALKGMLVLGTGNKVEDFGIGFFTKYGDGGVDLSPIADLTKSEVYKVARELGVIDSILNAPPTDGLWGDDRTDEDQIGASYPELEWAMQFVGSEDSLSTRQKEVLVIYRRLHKANRHKMIPIPVCEIPAYLKA
ncbi:MAG: NAD(+) synthase [Flavobacteriales bacterium]